MGYTKCLRNLKSLLPGEEACRYFAIVVLVELLDIISSLVRVFTFPILVELLDIISSLVRGFYISWLREAVGLAPKIEGVLFFQTIQPMGWYFTTQVSDLASQCAV